MLAKLLTLLAASKGAAVAAAVVLSAATVTVGASSPEVRDTVDQVVQAVTQTVTGTTTDDSRDKTDCDHGQPAAVAQRNAADKLLRAAFQVDHKALEDLRGKGVDNKAAGDVVKTADDQLKSIRTQALNDVGAQTVGAAAAAAGPCLAESPEALKPSPSPKTEAAAKPSQEGRVTVAERTTLDAKIKSIVDKAITDMAKVVTDAQAKVATLPSPDHGKPSENAGADNKPAGNPGDEHKPSASPKR